MDKAALAAIGPTLQATVAAGQLSGAVTLVWRRGEVVQVDTVGLRDIEANLPMERDTLFRIASMTKPVTSLAVMMLIEEGKLSLDAPVKPWLPELADRQVLKDATGPLDQTYPSPREITVEDLLTHRSGLAYNFTSTGPIAYAYDEKLRSAVNNPLTPDQWMAKLGELPLSYAPGERMHYSVSTDVLGVLVSRVEGKPLGQVLKERIFDPLGMTDTGFWVPPEKRGRMAKIYKNLGDGSPLTDASYPMGDTPPVFESGGGGLISTADDYLKFARAMVGGGEADGVRLVKPETLALMTANRLTDAQRAMPFLGFPIWMTQGFGLGVSMILNPEMHAMMGAGSKGSFGWPGAFGTWWQGDPEQDIIALFMIQDSLDLGPEAVTSMGQRPSGRLAGPMFQKLVYGAIRN